MKLLTSFCMKALYCSDVKVITGNYDGNAAKIISRYIYIVICPILLPRCLQKKYFSLLFIDEFIINRGLYLHIILYTTLSEYFLLLLLGGTILFIIFIINGICFSGISHNHILIDNVRQLQELL